jgi:hypothetical protein
VSVHLTRKYLYYGANQLFVCLCLCHNESTAGVYVLYGIHGASVLDAKETKLPEEAVLDMAPQGPAAFRH